MLVLTGLPLHFFLDTLHRQSFALGQKAMDMQTDTPDKTRAGKRAAGTPSSLQKPAKQQLAEATQPDVDVRGDV